MIREIKQIRLELLFHKLLKNGSIVKTEYGSIVYNSQVLNGMWWLAEQTSETFLIYRGSILSINDFSVLPIDFIINKITGLFNTNNLKVVICD